MSIVKRALGRLIHRGWDYLREAAALHPGATAGYRFRYFGEGACIAFPTGAIFGEQWIEIGDHTLIGERVTISAGMVPGMDLGPDPIVRIGRGCSIGRGSHIVGHESIVIGDDVFTGPYVYITDQNHAYDDPEVPIGRQWPRNKPVEIGSGSWIGAGAIILPGTKIGRQSVVAGGAVVRGEFPDHSVIAGVPAKIVKRHSPELGWYRTDSVSAPGSAGPGAPSPAGPAGHAAAASPAGPRAHSRAAVPPARHGSPDGPAQGRNGSRPDPAEAHGPPRAG